MGLHRCTEAECPYEGDLSPSSCGCHKTDERIMADAANALLVALKALVAADDAMLAFLLTADADKIGEEAWAAQHKERATHKRDATLAAIAGIKAAEAAGIKAEG
jgi:hypothetical protein